MIKRMSMVVLIAVLAVPIALLAAEKVKVEKLSNKTLPNEMYGQLQKAKKLSLVWKGQGFSSDTYQIVNVDWKAEDRNGTLYEYLKEQAGLLGEDDGHYTVDLCVTEYQGGKSGMMSNKHPLLTIEGTVHDGDAIILAFVTREKAKLGGAFSGFNENAMVDAVLSGVAYELMASSKGGKS